jgi:protein involved in temperature-dependent protein secretion
MENEDCVTIVSHTTMAEFIKKGRQSVKDNPEAELPRSELASLLYMAEEYEEALKVARTFCADACPPGDSGNESIKRQAARAVLAGKKKTLEPMLLRIAELAPLVVIEQQRLLLIDHLDRFERTELGDESA